MWLPKLLPEWRLILKETWSANLMTIAIALSGAEVVLPLFSDLIPRGPFAVLSFLVTCVALYARLAVQPKFQAKRDGNDAT